MTMVWAGVNMNYRSLWLAALRDCIVRAFTNPTYFTSQPFSSLELVNIFDSEQQPLGSAIRSRHSSAPKNPVKSGFGANTFLHSESTPDICALLSTYLSALPEPILLPVLFRPIWDWCGQKLTHHNSNIYDVVYPPSPFLYGWHENAKG